MNPRWRSPGLSLASIAVFAALLVATVRLVFPYVVTRQTYAGEQGVSPWFPIAVERNGAPAIVRWADYRNDPAQVENHLFAGEDGRTYELSDPDGESTASFSMRRSGGVWKVDYGTDDYDYWSEYRVVAGRPEPVASGFTGAFSVLYGLAAGLLGAWLFRRGMARRLAPEPSPPG